MKLLSLLILSTLISSTIPAQTTLGQENLQNENKAFSHKQVRLIYEKVKAFPEGTQVSIAVVKNGQVTFWGILRRKDTIEYSENFRKVFEIGSLSKVFTSTLLARMVLANKIGLDNKLTDYLEADAEVGSQITLKHLANHTSGLPRLPSNLNMLTADPKNPYHSYGEMDLMEYLAKGMKLSSSPGTNYEYSNLGAGLLGYILWKKEKSDYELMLKKYIFSKYKMTSSTSRRELIEDKLVFGLSPGGEQTSNWDFNVLVGAGGIYSNVDDLSKFVIAQFDESNKELQLTQKSTFSVNGNLEIGLAWHLIKRKDGSQWLWHNGGTGGYSSSITVDKSRRSAVILLSNVSAFHPANGKIVELGFELMGAE